MPNHSIKTFAYQKQLGEKHKPYLRYFDVIAREPRERGNPRFLMTQHIVFAFLMIIIPLIIPQTLARFLNVCSARIMSMPTALQQR